MRHELILCIGALVLFCFQQSSPFIFTKINSLGPLIPTPTTDTTTVSSVPDSTGSQSTDTTSSPESTNTTSSDPAITTPSNPECPTDIPVWVPVVVGVGSLVIGFVVAGTIFLCLCQKKKKMKGTGF